MSVMMLRTQVKPDRVPDVEAAVQKTFAANQTRRVSRTAPSRLVRRAVAD
jgi:hypothetical protein